MSKRKPKEELQKAGRPSSYTKELAELICLRIADGESLRTICEERNMPVKQTVRNWLDTRPAFLAQYRRAREDQADSLMEMGLQRALGATDHEQASCATVALRAIIWAASKLKPKVYGEKVGIDVGGTLGQKVTLDVRPSLARLMNDKKAWSKAKELAWLAGTKPTEKSDGDGDKPAEEA